jgi:NADH-quinone oxidoreductase subunit J
MAELIFFIVFALGAIAASLGVLIARNPVNSALALVVSFFFLSATYVLLNATFMAVIQILVYAGAIMVLFTFVLMLLNMGDEELGNAKVNITQLVMVVVAAGIVMVLIQAITAFPGATSQAVAGSFPESYGSVNVIGRELMTRYVLPFELAAVLLLVGIVSAVVVAKKRL